MTSVAATVEIKRFLQRVLEQKDKENIDNYIEFVGSTRNIG